MNEKQKFVLGIVVMVAAVGGLGLLHFLKLKQRSELQAKIDRYTRQAADAQRKIETIDTLRDEREKLIRFIDEYTEILPKEHDVEQNAFARIIDEYRKDTNINITGAEYLVMKEKKKRTRRRGQRPEPEKKKDFLRHRYKFQLQGTVPELIQFIAKIENNSRFLKVDAIKIRPIGTDADEDLDDLAEDQEIEMLAKAANEKKDIELTVSTYTYYKGAEKKTKS